MKRRIFHLFYFCFPLLVFIAGRLEAQILSINEQREIDSLNSIIRNKQSHDTALASAYVELSNILYVSNLDTVIPLCHKSISIAEAALKQSHDKKVKESLFGSMAGALNNLGFIYINRGDIAKGLDYYHRSLRIAEETGNKQGIATALNNIGPVYYHQGDTESALNYFNRSLKIKEEIDDKKGIAYTLNNIGSIYQNRGDIKTALDYFQRGLSIRKEIGDLQGVAYSLSNIGYAYEDLGQLEKTLKYFHQSLEIMEDLGDKSGISHAFHDIGSAYLKLGNLSEASKYGKKSLEISQELGLPENIRNSALHLSRVYEKQNKGMEALQMHKLFVQMRDSLNNEETQKAALKQQAKYEYEKQKAADDAENEKRKVIAEKEREKQKVMIYASAGGLALTLIFLAFVFNRLEVTRKQKDKIDKQKQEIEYTHQALAVHHKEISDSIIYAQRLQQAILPSQADLRKELKESFILFLPKNVVSGDFYWMEKVGDILFFAVADCTGHGVPGAMVSVVCSNALDRAVKEYNLTDTAAILNKVNELVIERFEKSGTEVKDGMDIALCAINSQTKILQFSGANNPLWLIRKKLNEEQLNKRDVVAGAFYMRTLSPDKQPIGKFVQRKPFTNHQIELRAHDSLYIFSDGFPDQFGGELGKKFKYKSFKELLLSIQQRKLSVQMEIIKDTFNEWKGNLEQVDDVCILGIRIEPEKL